MRMPHVFIILTLAVAPLSGQVSARAALLSADLDLSNEDFANGPILTFPKALGAAGVLVWPGAAVVRGDSAAAAFLRRQTLIDTARISWQPFRIEMAPDSSLAVLSGVAVIDRPATGPVTQIHRIGRYLAVWKRVAGTWKLAAFSLVNILVRGETIWTDATGPKELPLLPSTATGGAFIAADSAFAADAGLLGAGKAFAKWAAPDAITFAGTGELNVGPERIGAVLAGNTAKWQWGAVAAGSSDDGMLGWTVGLATITPIDNTAPSKSKYLTFWRKMADGSIKFTADGGSTRP